MPEAANSLVRVYKTTWFAKAARKMRIGDDELCTAIREAMSGQCDDLGSGVFKKRLNKNMHRSIILAKGGLRWFYVFVFAKKDRDNIDDDELAGFRKIAKSYEMLTEQQLKKLLKEKDLTEICHGNQETVQK